MNNDKKEKVFPPEYYGRKISGKIADYVKERFPAGNIAVIFAESVEKYADNVVKSLTEGGYAVRALKCDDRVDLCAAEAALDVSECVMYFIGVGSGKIADITRLAAAKKGIRYALVPTAPSTDGYIADKVPFITHSAAENCRFPDFLLVDEEIVEESPKRLVAAGYGRVAAQLVNVFDIEYSRTVWAEEYDGDALTELSGAIRRFEMDKNLPCFNVRLMKLLCEIARLNGKLNVKYTAADGFAHVLSECVGGRTSGETSFIAGYIILNFYRMFLKSENLDTLLPEDVVKTLKLLEKMRVVNYNEYVSEMAVNTPFTYLKTRFVLSEYREELYAKLESLDISALAKFWRRLYDDAGYWLKDYVNSATLLRYLSISAELADGSLLKYMKRLGFFEKFI